MVGCYGHNKCDSVWECFKILLNMHIYMKWYVSTKEQTIKWFDNFTQKDKLYRKSRISVYLSFCCLIYYLGLTHYAFQ